MTKKLLFLIVVSQFALVACKGLTGTPKDSSTSGENSIVDGADITPVLLLKHVDDLELEAVSELCPKESGRDFCVVICHVPPGNPQRAKTLLIPHQAVNAHINHGSDKHDHHDFVGGCDQLPDLDIEDEHPGCKNGKGKKKDCHNNNDDSGEDSDDDGSTNDDDSSDDSSNNDSGNNDDGENGALDTPIFCDPLYESDLDCDGLDDETLEPLF